ncbi:hypothetical protein AALP_AA6G131100 [Arabis alpina]|uniref:TIR domain-containing protein n=1 Tax=Arabis alpina TaxID=50452 RepID=A0A087GNY0_ARAAL|nr:hypothetical protein AALP_AA6G131100 [Arabis alpina]
MEETSEKTLLQRPQVFLSFRGAEVRQSFVSHLVKVLEENEVNVYVEAEELNRGDPLKSTFKVIEESRIALVIFSKRYTESLWCLDELVKIKERVEQGKLVVIPIFYELNPSQVEGLDGDFGINLWNHVKRTSEFDKLTKWKEALVYVSVRMGFVFTHPDSNLSTFIVEIVKHVKNEVSSYLLWSAKSDVNPKEDEVKFPGKLRRDDGLDLIKADSFIGETNSDATSKLQNSAEVENVDPVNEEKKQENENESSTMVAYDNPFSKHKVFINFRGAEGLRVFVSHLVMALKLKGASVYVEGGELRGSTFEQLFKRIEASTIALVIFSPRYTESKWCLDELVKIKELRDEGKILAIPIFYKVESSEVLNLNGEFGDNFWNLWRLNRDHHVIKWKEALNSVASGEDGFCWKEHSSERDLVNFVNDVQKAILKSERENPFFSPSTERKGENNETYLNLNKRHLFGMEQRMEQMEKKLEFVGNDTRIIGVVGMPGIEDHEPEWLRKTLLEVLLAGQSQVISDKTTHGSVKVELLKTKIFAVLDDVSDKKQLEFLLDDRDWIRKGSKIVITTPTGTFLTLSRMFVDYGGGHPLALNILDVLGFSTDHLNESQEDAFLDIVCFFKSEDEYFVRSLLDSGDPDSTGAVSEVKDLVNKFLITISDNRVEMNVLLYYIAKDIGSSRWLRLWNYKDIINELKSMKTSEANNFPLEKLPPDFIPKNLVDLRLPYSKLQRVWEGFKETPRLKWVDLSHSSKLRDLSALSKADKLQKLNLEGCTVLAVLPVEIQNMNDCSSLKEFRLISESVEFLHLDGTAIKGLPLAIQNLRRLIVLNLKNCKMLESLPNGLGELKALEELILSGCSNLQNLSDIRESMSHLQSLLMDRIGAKEMPNISCTTVSEGQVSADLVLQSFGPREWPRGVNGCRMLTSIPMLPPKLQYFDAYGCDSLERVANPLALQVLSEQNHATFNFSNCNKLDQDAKESIISYTRKKSLLVLDALSRYNGGSILEDFTGTCFPGWEVPAWFSHQASGSLLKPKLPPHWFDDKITGIGLCAVILFPTYHGQRNRVLVRCNCEFKNEEGSTIRFSCSVGGWSDPINTPRKINSSHVFIGFTSMMDNKKHSEEEDEEKCNHTEASIEFQVTDGTEVLEGYEVLNCGFSVVYATNEMENISWDARTDVNPETVENILGEETSYGNSWSHDEILYQSYSGVILDNDEKFFSEGKSDASPSIQKNFEDKRVDVLNEESDAGKESILSSYHDNKSSGNLEMHRMRSLAELEFKLKKMSKDLGSSERHKLWNYKDIIDKLTNMEQPEANNVRSIFLDMSEITESIALEYMTFTDMRNLLYLKIYNSSCPWHCKAESKLYFPDGLEFPLEEIRYLHWVKFPLEELPPDFKPENLVDLRLPYSKLERVWEGIQDIPWLKWVDLSHSSKLLDLSALSRAENLQRLNLEGCTSLNELPLEIQNMKSLVLLNLRGCIRLSYLPKMNLISLKTLILSDCANLKEFQLISESVEFLHLDGTSIKGLPPAIQKLKRLFVLNLKNCRMLKCLPNCLGEMKTVEVLILSGCSSLKNLSDVRESMQHLQSLLLDRIGAKEMSNISCVNKSEDQASADIFVEPIGQRKWPLDVSKVFSLQRLSLSGNDFVSLQTDIGQLYNLKWLDMTQCKNLRFVPTLPPRIQYFDAHGCDSLERVANPLAFPVLPDQIHATFNFSNCNKLDQDAKDSIMSYTRRRSQLVLDELRRYDGGLVLEVLIGTCFPGWEVPAWFSHRARGSVLKLKLPPHWCDNKFTGIGVCAVIVFNGCHNQTKRVLVKCNCEFKNEDGSSTRFSCTVGGWSEPSNTPRKIESSHVFIGFTSRLDIKKHSEEEEEEKCVCTETSIEFQVTDGAEEIKGCEVVKCGFSFVYAPDERMNTNRAIPRLSEAS